MAPGWTGTAWGSRGLTGRDMMARPRQGRRRRRVGSRSVHGRGWIGLTDVDGSWMDRPRCVDPVDMSPCDGGDAWDIVRSARRGHVIADRASGSPDAGRDRGGPPGLPSCRRPCSPSEQTGIPRVRATLGGTRAVTLRTTTRWWVRHGGRPDHAPLPLVATMRFASRTTRPRPGCGAMSARPWSTCPRTHGEAAAVLAVAA